MFCKHKWKVIDKTVLPSAFQQAAALDRPALLRKIVDWSEWTGTFFVTTVQVIVTCEHCGKLQKFREENP